jgi:membrane protease YdiL (CAAX protease family)
MRAIIKNPSSPWPFFVGALGFSWLFWIIAGVSLQPFDRLPTLAFYLLGGLAPLLVALTFLYTLGDRLEIHDFWIRAVDVRRIGPVWWLVTLLTPPALAGLSILVDQACGGGPFTPIVAEPFSSGPVEFIPYALLLFFLGPLPEELAWRGYSLDRLQRRWNALNSSLILGTIWTVWHLPLFFIDGTYQNGLGFGTLNFWLFMLDKVPQSVLMTWIYNNNRRSTLTAILYHYMVNLTGELWVMSARAEVLYICIQILAAVAVTAAFGPSRLARGQKAAIPGDH